MNLKQTAVRGVVWSAIEQWGQQAGVFLVFAMLARLLDTSAFGVIALAETFLALLQVFLDQGFETAIVQKSDISQEHLNSAFWINLGISFLTLFIAYFLSDLVADFYEQSSLSAILKVLPVVLIVRSLGAVHQSILIRDLAFRFLAVRSLCGVIFGGIVSIFMAFSGYGVWSLVGQQITSVSVETLVLWMSCSWRPRIMVSKGHLKELLSFGLNIIGFNLFNFLNRNSDNLLIGYFLGASALGYYTIAYRLIQTLTQLISGITAKVALPTFSKLQGDREKMRDWFLKVVRLTSIFSFPLFAGIAVFASDIISLVFGENWGASIPIMQVLSFIGILHSIAYFDGVVMVANGKPAWRFLVSIFNAVTNVLAFLLVVRWGILAVAVAYVVGGYIRSPLRLWLLNRILNVHWMSYSKQFFPAFMSAFLAALTLLIVRYYLEPLFGQVLLLILTSILGAVLYLSVLMLVSPNSVRQIRDVFNVLYGR